MTYATPRSVRARCLALMKSLIQESNKVKISALKIYIMRKYLIRPETFDRYLEELVEMKLITINSDTALWVNEEISLEAEEGSE